MRAALGFLALPVLASFAIVGCRIDYDEFANLQRSRAGSNGQGGSGNVGLDGGGNAAGDAEAGAGPSSGGNGGGTGGSAGTSAGSGGNAGVGTGGRGGAGGNQGGTPGTGGSSGGAGSGAGAMGGLGGGGAGSSGGAGSGGSAMGGFGGGGSGGAGGAPSMTDCMPGSFAGKAYLMCSPEITWVAARDACASVGMALARVDSTEENQWLFDNAYDLDVLSDGLWIGASDELVEGEWRWTDGTLFWLGDSTGVAQGGLFTNWYSNHPGGNALNDCGVIDLGAGTSPGWYSDRCDAGTNVFACESP